SMIRMSASKGWFLAVVAALASCTPNAGSPRGAYDGTLAMSNDGKYLYTVNADTGTVTVVDAAGRQVVATVPVGASPARVIVGPDDTLYVSNRGSRSVSVIHRGEWTEASRIAVGAEPIGLALSKDGSTLYVASSASATLDAIDLTTPADTKRWESQLSDYPHGVAVLPDGRLYVSHYRSGLVDVVDPASGNVTSQISTAVGIDPALATGGFGATGPAPTFKPVALDSIVVSHDGTRAYLVHRRDRNGVIRTDRPVGYYTALANTTPVVVPALTTIDIASGAALDDATNAHKDYPPTVLFPAQNSAVGGSFGSPPTGGAVRSGTGGSSGGGGGYGGGGFSGAPWSQGPVASVEDPQGQFLYVANENTDDVTVYAAHARTGTGTTDGVVADVAVGFAPTGLALSRDEQTLYVHNSLDYSVSIVQRSNGTLVEIGRITVSSPGNLDPDVVEGRRLFFSATDPVMTVPGAGVSCESCHLEGATDGNVWQFTHGPRKTPSLLGRDIKETAPYHWDGTEADFHGFFAETVQVRMGGQGVDDQQSAQISSFMEQLATPDNPYRLSGGLTASQQRGKALFYGKAFCAACHTGEQLTDNTFHDVGTFVSVNPDGNPDDACRLDPSQGSCVGTGPNGESPRANPENTVHGFNTPSLLGVVWAAPYLHDGSAVSLLDRLTHNPGDAHGHTSALSSGDMQDLVSYLQTL
ncbi:MAG: beta-propeller fold lactonase family protein, partial [Deltaproteobacteria bacterium]